MSVDSTQVYVAALALPEDQRAHLACRLLESLAPESGLSEEAPDFAEELERRVQSYEDGQTTAAEWDVVSARLREALDRREAS